jgi:hypothetical protein
MEGRLCTPPIRIKRRNGKMQIIIQRVPSINHDRIGITGFDLLGFGNDKVKLLN